MKKHSKKSLASMLEAMIDERVDHCVRQIVEEKLPEIEDGISKRVRISKLKSDGNNSDDKRAHPMFDPLAGP